MLGNYQYKATVHYLKNKLNSRKIRYVSALSLAVERLAFNQNVVGSIPTVRATYIFFFKKPGWTTLSPARNYVVYEGHLKH